jgi:hypothetical protein
MKKTAFLVLVAGAMIGSAYSNPLKPSDPEYVQLTAMGYDITATETGSLAQRNDTTILVLKSEKLIFLGRYFSLNPKKVASKEYKTLQLLNKLNIDLAFQLAITEDKDSLMCGQYYRGAYDRKSFATVVSEIEGCNLIFDKAPELLELGKE